VVLRPSKARHFAMAMIITELYLFSLPCALFFFFVFFLNSRFFLSRPSSRPAS
jgi:hypothetical protein